MLRIEKVSKSFKKGILAKEKTTAVCEVSLNIEEGQTIGILGNSGCGKTTLSRMLTGILPPDEGTIFYKGKDIYKMQASWQKQYHREVQLIFQNPESSLNPSLTILGNLLIPMDIHYPHLTKEVKLKKLEELMVQLGIRQHLLSRYPHQISGGEAQRIVLCRALALEPKVMIFDESTAMLDVSVQAQIITLLKELQQQFHLTYIYITHDLELISIITEILVVMKEGRIVEQGRTYDIMQGAKHPYTRTLIEAFKNWEDEV